MQTNTQADRQTTDVQMTDRNDRLEYPASHVSGLIKQHKLYSSGRARSSHSHDVANTSLLHVCETGVCQLTTKKPTTSTPYR